MFVNAPDVKFEEAEMDGVAPEYYHSTSMYPEYFKINGNWVLAEESRMDSSVVICDDGHLAVVENRNLKKGDKVILGRSEKAEEGIYMHCNGFTAEGEDLDDQFVFRQGRTCSSCSGTSGSTEISCGSWARHFPSTTTPEPPCRPWWRTAMPTA